MTWLHVARTELGWLAIPGIDDPLFTWAVSNACPGLRYLPTARGWLIPHSQEAGMWSAVAATHGAGIVCPLCLHDSMPCDSWVNVLASRFEAAKTAKEPAAWGERNFGKRHRARPWQEPPPRPAPKVSKEDKLRAAAKTLGVTLPANKEAVKKAFRAAIMRAHPDLGGSERKATEVIAARDLLLGPESSRSDHRR